MDTIICFIHVYLWTLLVKFFFSDISLSLSSSPLVRFESLCQRVRGLSDLYTKVV